MGGWRTWGLTLICLAGLARELPPSLRVPFLAQAPKIDGALDAELADLPAFLLQAPDANGEVRARVAYGADFLYVQVEAAQDSVRCRDRAYQNGDGLLLAVATALPGGDPADEFRVLGFSPQLEGQRTWQYAFTWYRDRALEMAPLPGARFAWSSGGGRVSFELLVPWSSIPPYHPWLRGPGSIGLNLAYVQAEAGSGKTRHALVEDPRLGSENSPRRYLPLSFEAPGAKAGLAWAAEPLRANLRGGESLGLRVAAVGSAGAGLPLSVRILNGEGEVLVRRRVETPAGPAPYPTELDLALRLPVGGYQLEVEGPGSTVLRRGVTVLPGVDGPACRSMLEVAKTLAQGSRSTLAFRLAEAEAALAGLKPHETAGRLRASLEELDRDLRAAASGQDPVASRTGIQRRAYRSALDGTLQPYTVRIPQGLKPGLRVPLLVYLHGSGDDDRGMLDRSRAPEGWIQLAPRGRGTSNCYSADLAQDDLREAVADVLAHYPVDPERVFLAGFSMGGYGVYRTALAQPGRFRGLAVLAGQPDLGPQWLGGGHPDALDPANLARLKGETFFIVHGMEDRNCPYAKTVQMVEGLKAAGAKVTFLAEPGRGHDGPSAVGEARYLDWLRELAN
ncbi:MAG: prolyl oligopeptidase family serine peptidase [Geothrix sp.]|uniref:prolyl oligopeptidase family serine peptidase n=1 Tax=Geothrix sp. TaxID=1962974 RepID=UPI0018243A4C|nr:prolyl oligopeptidase family serine peptidase [Geothrix sp.]NWJ39833.1 prolyl oligopeptidase family serine peptidase [Geothrix sp.]WIL22154.1 MAG: prolyl oligopeptidase family serine peptidase [Geothrix sp.]